jgi:hypothetical protein
VVRRLAIAAIIAICLGAPIAEMFDSWDDTQNSGNDTEANVVVVALCVGVAFAVGSVVVASRIRAVSSTPARRRDASHVVVRALIALPVPVPTTSPPAILRV